MERIRKLNLGVIYRKTNSFWNIEHLTSKLNLLSNNLNLHLIELSELKEKSLSLNLDAVTMLPADTDILPQIISCNQNIFWVHSMFSGVEKFLAYNEIVENDKISLTNSKGAFGDSLAEFAIFSMLYFSYNAAAYIDGYSKRKWITPLNKMITGKTLAIIGYGLNGSILAKKAKGHDMKIIGVKKNTQEYEGKEYVDEIFNIKEIDNVLPRADFVVNFLPNTSETVNYYNMEKFKLMKNTSVFINLGRGSSVNEEDLVACLREKVILAASLDVFKSEPLPSNSAFYDLDNVFISCHSCDFTDEYFNQAVDVLIANLKKYFNEGSFATYVDKKKGY